jgi:hypothetical protein
MSHAASGRTGELPADPMLPLTKWVWLPSRIELGDRQADRAKD